MIKGPLIIWSRRVFLTINLLARRLHGRDPAQKREIHVGGTRLVHIVMLRTLLLVVLSFMFSTTTSIPVQATPVKQASPEFFTLQEVKVLIKLLEKIADHPRGLVQVARNSERGFYDVRFDQASDSYLVIPHLHIAIRLEPRGKDGQRQPTRLYGHADYAQLVHTIASEANETIPTLTKEEERDEGD